MWVICEFIVVVVVCVGSMNDGGVWCHWCVGVGCPRCWGGGFVGDRYYTTYVQQTHMHISIHDATKLNTHTCSLGRRHTAPRTAAFMSVSLWPVSTKGTGWKGKLLRLTQMPEALKMWTKDQRGL